MENENTVVCPTWSRERSEKPPIGVRFSVPLKCENCGKEIDGSYGSGRFCNITCRCSFNAKKASSEGRLERLAYARSQRKTLSGFVKGDFECKYCGKHYKDNANCSKHEKHCKQNPNRVEISDAWKQAMKKMHENAGGCFQKEQEFVCRYCGKKWVTIKSGYKTHELRCYSNPNRKAGSFLGKKHTDEQKRKISESTKKAHDEGRGHTWKNRYLNPSYAEQWLYGFLDSRNIQYKKEVPFKGFFLDVLVGKDKVIEIDGEQHYLPEGFPEQIDRDQRKDKLLKENGYKELRLRWSLVQSDKENQVRILESFLND